MRGRDARAGLARDARGGAQGIGYVMLVAGVAIVAMRAARGLDRSARDSFEGSTVRFDRPGTYVGGDVSALPRGGATGGGGGGDATTSWSMPQVRDAVLPEGQFQRVGYSCEQDKADSVDAILAGGFKSWCQEGGCADPEHPDPAEWGHYWCEVAAAPEDRCSVDEATTGRSRSDLASRNYNFARRALLQQLGCFGGDPLGEPSDPRRGYGWQNIACFWLSPEYLAALYGCLPPSWSPPMFPPVRGAPIDPPALCKLPSFDPNQTYCQGI